MDKSCSNHEYNLYELLLPSPTIFNTLCESKDRTSLFLSTIVRILIWLYISNYLDENKYDKNIYNFAYMMFLFNCLYLIWILIKTPQT